MDWSASKVNCANYCRRKFFLRYILRDKGIIFSSYRRGTLCHELVEKFWDKLGAPEEVKMNKEGKVKSEKKYSNPEQFVKYAQGRWMRMCIQDEMAGKKIQWAYDNEKWNIRNKYLPGVCSPLFNILLEEGPHLYTELPFTFILNDRKFTGFIDKVRQRDGRVIIRDYKTESPWMKGMKLEGNPQLTLYCVGLCALCYADENVAAKVGLLEERKRFMGNPIFISDKIQPEFFMLSALPKISKQESEKSETEKAIKVIYSTKRSDKDFYEVLMFIEDVERDVRDFLSGARKKIPPTERGKKCDGCDMAIGCLKRLEDELAEEKRIGPLKASDGQIFFNFASPYFCQPFSKAKQRRLRWKRR